MNYEPETLRKVSLRSGHDLTIRRPAEQDSDQMISYLNTVGGESDNLLFGKDEIKITPEKEAEFIQRMNNDTNSLMLVGLVDGSIVSVAQVSSLGRKRIAHNSELGISVKKDFWGMGVGSAMMEELIRFARKNDVIKNVSLGVKASNTTAIKLYEKFGFTKVGVHRNYFNVNGSFDEEILMDLYL